VPHDIDNTDSQGNIIETTKLKPPAGDAAAPVKPGEQLHSGMGRHILSEQPAKVGYDGHQRGIPICHSHLGAKDGISMAVNRRLMGKVVQHLIQTHLLNAQHFDHSDYVQKCTDSYMQESHKMKQEAARRIVNAMKTSAVLGKGTTVSPDAQEVCHLHDDDRIGELSDRHDGQASLMLRSKVPHVRELGLATQKVIDTLWRTLAMKVGSSGYQVSDFLVNGSALSALVNQSQTTSQAHKAHVQKVAQIQSQHGLKNPYTYLSQEFLRDRLINDFQRTMSRREAATKATGVIRRVTRPLSAASAKDGSAKPCWRTCLR